MAHCPEGKEKWIWSFNNWIYAMKGCGYEGRKESNDYWLCWPSEDSKAAIVVISLAEEPKRYLVIDGYKRIRALRRLVQDQET